MSVSIFDRAQTSARFIRERINTQVDVAVVLGSGLGVFAETLEDKIIVPYEEIPDFARSTVEGHSGRLVVGKLPGAAVNVAVMQGRFHYYEGYSLDEVTLPIRAFNAMGVEKLVLTNAAGGVREGMRAGDLMLISDHINLMMVSPLRGRHDSRLGDRFPDMSEVYSREYRRIAKETAAEMGLALTEGIYMSLQGPNYETPAEIRMMRVLGADAVGMSTVPEAIVARQMGMRTLGISLITNAAAGMEDGPINHSEVMEMGHRVSKEFCGLLAKILVKL
ncbi:MAG TPA: purine-nucleoside phosphorylase [Blastocatellia bacterium]|nr:purine-nucleoside phosphorylase [Blastocatellia bacterium]HMV82690.1 purine-nucleoside phosphorylase [Blastocatellia bacterium]HMX27339.1 purine-nucleoside phosphorylase [Blastocatellia bacterium]HMY74970.1 purine-nucleoside phosphorylase [Blastocatellia bacterium]HMZ16793.1 purine-nucleoside phosphorylase [Blastocatellia bacterium]